MKKSIYSLILIFVLTSLSTIDVKGQWSSSGIKGGLTYSNLYIDVDDVDDENARVGFNVGVYSKILFSDVFGIQPELLYTTKGSEAVYTGLLDQTVDFRLSYIELPVLLVFQPADIFEVHIGPYAGLLLQSDAEFDGTFEGVTELDRDHFNTFDYGVAAGIALNLQSISIGLRYYLGLQEVADDSTSDLLLGDSKHSYAQLYIGVNLNYQP